MHIFSRVTAVVLAAGKGSRFGGNTPKQFQKIGEKTPVEMSLSAFENNSMTDAIILVLDPKDPDYDERSVQYITEYSKIRTIVPGGKERQDSVSNALKYVPDGVVLIHDSARPYVTDDVINRVIEAADKDGAAVPVVSPKDTIRTSGSTLDRKSLYQVQTPQGFRTDVFKTAYEKAKEDSFLGTDDASLYERMGKEVTLVEGDYRNIKITTPDDVKEESKVTYRSGNGFDVHRLVEGRRLFLCGVEIPSDKGLLGHSDADVALHALMDAMLGAAALGDIGRHFPDSDPEYLGCSSLMLLSEVNRMIKEKGYSVTNADITVICERPKIASYISDMTERVAGTLGIDKDRINIKGTTTEKLGFTGRGEGIASLATCMLEKKEG